MNHFQVGLYGKLGSAPLAGLIYAAVFLATDSGKLAQAAGEKEFAALFSRFEL